MNINDRPSAMKWPEIKKAAALAVVSTKKINRNNPTPLPLELWLKISEAADFPIPLIRTCKYFANIKEPFFFHLLCSDEFSSSLKQRIKSINERFPQISAEKKVKALHKEIRQEAKDQCALVKEYDYEKALSIRRLNDLQKDIDNVKQNYAPFPDDPPGDDLLAQTLRDARHMIKLQRINQRSDELNINSWKELRFYFVQDARKLIHYAHSILASIKPASPIENAHNSHE